jgi:hypothetical protein
VRIIGSTLLSGFFVHKTGHVSEGKWGTVYSDILSPSYHKTVEVHSHVMVTEIWSQSLKFKSLELDYSHVQRLGQIE